MIWFIETTRNWMMGFFGFSQPIHCKAMAWPGQALDASDSSREPGALANSVVHQFVR